MDATLNRTLVSALAAAGIVAGAAVRADQPADDQDSAPVDHIATLTTEHAPRKPGRIVADHLITAKVKSKLATQSGTRFPQLEVKTLNGVVALSGTLPSPVAVERVEVVVRQVKGVRNVDTTGLRTAGPS